jgi:hypothetical protein
MKFVDREQELAFLRDQANPRRAALVILYGRRRTGKTELLRRFADERRSVFFVADAASRPHQLAAFSQVAWSTLGEPGLAGTALPSWEAALRFLGDKARKQPLLLVLDEVPHLCWSDPALPSVLQRLWDAELRHTRLHLVLCGSYVSFMEQEILGAKTPLYGRRTGALLLEPFGFGAARQFFPHYRPGDQITAYAVLGGIPAYLELFDDRRSIARNVIERVLSRGAALYDEPRFLLLEELRDPRIYFSLCQAIAFGRTTPNEIAQGAGLADRGMVSRYLETLRELRIVERRTPPTERNPERTRRGRYRLADPFIRFWFRFVLPNRSALEAGDPAAVFERRIAPELDLHVSVIFEMICQQALWAKNNAGALPARYDRIGAWWRAKDEVDLVAVADRGDLLLAECKWSVRPVGTDILDRLVARAPLVVAELDRPAALIRYALFSRSGFTRGLERRARDEGVLLYGLKDLIG